MYLEIRTDTWETARRFGKCIAKGPEWVFRGQANSNWDLTTTFERSLKSFNYPIQHCKNSENFIIEQFRRRAHHYIPSPPKDSEILEWLALIQHHGGPTRLLDFTYSFYVATFFAVERASNDAVVWAINTEQLEEEIDAVLDSSGFEDYSDDEDGDLNAKHLRIASACIVEEQPIKLVVNVESYRMLERQIIQKGLFLFPCDIKSSFLTNLTNTFRLENTSDKKKEVTFTAKDNFDYQAFSEYPVAKLIIRRNSHKYALSDLNEMNINSTTLFPGLDGFARSLFYSLRAFDIDDETYTYF